MSAHSFLYGVLVSLTSSVNYITTHAPVPDGFLKYKLHYEFKFTDFEELRQKDLCIPDGLILSEQKKFLMIPECKSALSNDKDEEPRIQHQINSYSSPEFHGVLHNIIQYEDYEIVLFTFSDVVPAMIEQLRVMEQNDANIVIWSFEEDPFKNEVHVRKVDGNHTDTELDRLMSIGVSCEPPAREFIDPDMPEPRIAYVLGGRLLCTYGESLLKGNMTIKPAEFRKGNLDLVLSENRLNHFLRVLNKLVPGLGNYDPKTGNMVLKRHINAERVRVRLDEVGKMTTEEYRKTLGFPTKEESYRKLEKETEETLRPKRTPTLDELWGAKS